MVTIAHISDPHVGSPYFVPNLMNRVITELNQLRPDAVVCTGDLTTEGFRQEYKNWIAYAVQPTRGPSAGGITVHIFGTGLTGAAVSFGGTGAGVHPVSDVQLDADLPPGTPGAAAPSALEVQGGPQRDPPRQPVVTVVGSAVVVGGT